MRLAALLALTISIAAHAQDSRTPTAWPETEQRTEGPCASVDALARTLSAERAQIDVRGEAWLMFGGCRTVFYRSDATAPSEAHGSTARVLEALRVFLALRANRRGRSQLRAQALQRAAEIHASNGGRTNLRRIREELSVGFSIDQQGVIYVDLRHALDAELHTTIRGVECAPCIEEAAPCPCAPSVQEDDEEVSWDYAARMEIRPGARPQFVWRDDDPQ